MYDLNFEEETDLTESFGKDGGTVQEEQQQTARFPESMEISDEAPISSGIHDITTETSMTETTVTETTQTPGRTDERKRKRKKGSET